MAETMPGSAGDLGAAGLTKRASAASHAVVVEDMEAGTPREETASPRAAAIADSSMNEAS